MIELLENTSIIIVSKLRELALPHENTVQVFPANLSSKKVFIKRGRSEEKITQPTTWIMPPQPEAYIKYPRYDFL